MNSRPNSYQKQLVRYRYVALLEVYIDSERVVITFGLIMKHHEFLVSENQ